MLFLNVCASVCARPLFLIKRLPSPFPSPTRLMASRYSSCALDVICVPVCVCLYVHVCKCVMQSTNINKYKLHRDDVTYNVKLEM